MPIFNFESKAEKTRRQMREASVRIGREAAKDFIKYDPSSDPSLAKLCKVLGSPHPKKRDNH